MHPDITRDLVSDRTGRTRADADRRRLAAGARRAPHAARPASAALLARVLAALHVR